MVKLIENKGRFSITIPKSLVKLAKWEKGKELIVLPTEKGELVVKEVF